MSVTKRLQRELAEIQGSGVPSYNNVEIKDNNLLNWTVLLLPEREPYSKGAFRLQIEFSNDYPFKPPKLTLLTQIYHPNVDEEGQICLGIVQPGNWKPATRTEQVLLALLQLINDPEPEHPLRAELAEEFRNDRQQFLKKALRHTEAHAEKRSK